MERPKRGDPRDRALGERLRAMRHRWRETQEQFARHFPVGRQAYVSWERSGVPPGSQSLLVRMVLEKLGALDRGRKKIPKDTLAEPK